MRRACAALCTMALACGGATAQERVHSGTGAVLRALDRITTEVHDLDLAAGDSARIGSLRVIIDEPQSGARQFDGWMVASSPALNALEHPRYDVWVMRCTT